MAKFCGECGSPIDQDRGVCLKCQPMATTDAATKGCSIASEAYRWAGAASSRTQRIVILIAATVGVLSIFLPWTYAPMVGAVYGTTSTWPWIAALILLPAIYVAVTGKHSAKMDTQDRLTCAVPASISLLIVIWRCAKVWLFVQEGITSDNRLTQIAAMSIHFGIGVYLIIAASVTVAVAAMDMARD